MKNIIKIAVAILIVSSLAGAKDKPTYLLTGEVFFAASDSVMVSGTLANGKMVQWACNAYTNRIACTAGPGGVFLVQLADGWVADSSPIDAMKWAGSNAIDPVKLHTAPGMDKHFSYREKPVTGSGWGKTTKLFCVATDSGKEACYPEGR